MMQDSERERSGVAWAASVTEGLLSFVVGRSVGLGLSKEKACLLAALPLQKKLNLADPLVCGTIISASSISSGRTIFKRRACCSGFSEPNQM